MKSVNDQMAILEDCIQYKDGSPNVLVIAKNDLNVIFLHEVLKKASFNVFLIHSLEDAFFYLLDRKIDVIISELHMPSREESFNFIKQVRSLSGYYYVPILLWDHFSNQEDINQSFLCGVDDCIQKINNLTELFFRIRVHLRKYFFEKCSKDDEFMNQTLKGTCSQVSLAGLMSILEMEERSGILKISNYVTKEKGAIYFQKGLPTYAFMSNSEKSILKHHEAAYYILGWSKVCYEFKNANLNLDNHINTSVTALLLEAARRIDSI